LIVSDGSLVAPHSAMAKDGEVLKRIALIARRADYTPERFRAHWSGPHADIIRSIIAYFPDPHEVRYTQNRVDGVLWQHSSSGECFDVDGFVELHLTANKPSDEAYSSGAAGRMLEDEPNFLRAFMECFVEPEGDDSPDSRGSKIIIVAARKEQTGLPDFVSAIRQSLGPATSRLRGVRRVCMNWVTSTRVRDKLSYEPVPPDVVIELWVENAAVALELAGVCHDLIPVAAKQSAYKIDPLQVFR
jgi:hypothetical protein